MVLLMLILLLLLSICVSCLLRFLFHLHGISAGLMLDIGCCGLIIIRGGQCRKWWRGEKGQIIKEELKKRNFGEIERLKKI